MADEPTTDPITDTPTEPDAPVEPQETTLDAAALQRELAEARKEAAKSRTELRKLTDAQKAADDAKLSEQERMVAELAELRKAIETKDAHAREVALQATATTLAVKLGYADPDDALLIAGRALARGDIEFDDDGAAVGLDKLLGDELKAKPHLKGATKPADLAQGDRADKPTLTLEQLRGKDREWVLEHMDEVKAVLGAAGR